MTNSQTFEIVIIGAGLAGISTAYHLSKKYKKSNILLVDSQQPLSYTSAQSGNNYRNWWPHPVMAELSNRSIELMQQIADDTNNRINMVQGGYILATRKTNIQDEMQGLQAGFNNDDIRVHTTSTSESYINSLSLNWKHTPDGVDILSNPALIQKQFPDFTQDLKNIIHIRNAGDIDGEQLGQYMFEKCKALGVKFLCSEVKSIEYNNDYKLTLDSTVGTKNQAVIINADILVNAAGPFVKKIAKMLNVDLPVENLFEQKISFADTQGIISREQPFSIDLDEQTLNWSAVDKKMLAEDESTQWLSQPIHGGVHCRPDGGLTSNRVKLGWAYNHNPSDPQRDFHNDVYYDPSFPEIVLRGASGLNPKLKYYVDNMPANFSHYGGYYTMTNENWPLIGPMDNNGAFIVGALSGFGTMTACAVGELCADWVNAGSLPTYAHDLSLKRYDNKVLIYELTNSSNKGVL